MVNFVVPATPERRRQQENKEGGECQQVLRPTASQDGAVAALVPEEEQARAECTRQQRQHDGDSAERCKIENGTIGGDDSRKERGGDQRTLGLRIKHMRRQFDPDRVSDFAGG
jgi:hypothetical protein